MAVFANVSSADESGVIRSFKLNETIFVASLMPKKAIGVDSIFIQSVDAAGEMRFTLDGLECNKNGVSYEAYNRQPNFCSSPFWSCLHNQLCNYWEVCREELL
ncbi:hypothetical protein NE237_029809 [Protea cynaroides]|uniref:Generative cell specific-1/HAP2 domain-containing protein n=1 Tax=Protea cynaroides TaxID=273540 RepID=A0A9Q0GW06_9MAGN|nr:hypothetical protein NE237_029809 [Protea cynaroides]